MITRVWGKADGFALELTRSGGKWVIAVPPDVSDGQYAVELHALSSGGETGMWTGILYMSGGVCVRLEFERFAGWLQPERYCAELQPERYIITMKAGCRCGKQRI
jgi:hypothetical protein